MGDYGLHIPPQHAKLLEQSAIPAEVARDRGYESVEIRKRLENLGFERYQRSVPGLLIPGHRADGSVGDTSTGPMSRGSPRLARSSTTRRRRISATASTFLPAPVIRSVTRGSTSGSGVVTPMSPPRNVNGPGGRQAPQGQNDKAAATAATQEQVSAAVAMLTHELSDERDAWIRFALSMWRNGYRTGTGNRDDSALSAFAEGWFLGLEAGVERARCTA